MLGEAPGPREDERGSPFVGPSGALIDEAMREAGLEGAYYTNVVKCYPNRKPLRPKPDEIKACRPYLDEQLAERKPFAVLALGETPWHRLGGVGKITENEGREVWSAKHGFWIMPARHPAYVLRNRGVESSWKLVIHRYARLLRGELHDTPPVETHIVKDQDGLGRLSTALRSAQVFAYDFETLPIHWADKDWKALSIAFSMDEGYAWAVPIAHPQSPFLDEYGCLRPMLLYFLHQVLVPIMTDPKRKKIAHNMIFDDLVFYRLTGTLPHTTCDTMDLTHTLDENRPKGLKWQLRARLGWPDYGLDTKKLAQMPLDEVLQYNGYDAAGTLQLRNVLLKELAEDPRLARYYARVRMPGIRAVERIVANGIHLDRARAEQVHADLVVRRDGAAALLPVENPGSPPQVGRWLYDDLKLPVLKRTETGQPSTDEETIWKLAKRHPQVKVLLDWRKHAKNLSTYIGPPLLESTRSVDGRIHPEYRIGGSDPTGSDQRQRDAPKTGRLASRFHTTPRDETIRSIYSAPEGCVLLSADYRQIEARLVAWAAAGAPATWEDVQPGNSRMLRAFRKDIDVYVLMASAALGKPVEAVTKKDRQEMGKVPTLACLYRISAKGLQEYAWLQYQLEWSANQAAHLHATFYRLWPEIQAWHTLSERLLMGRGWTQSVIGRKRRLPDAMNGGEGAYESINSGINMPIQSLASDITMTGASLWQERFWDSSFGRLVGFVHDSLMVECEGGTIERTAEALISCMLDAPCRLEPLGLRIPDGLVQVEVSAGPWGSKKTVAEYLSK